MAINSTITSSGGFSAVISGFVGQMYLEDLPAHTPFAAINFPETNSDAFQVVNVSQFVPITDMDAFTTFNTWLLHNDTLRVTVSGDTFIRVSGISKEFPVTFQKTIEMPGTFDFLFFVTCSFFGPDDSSRGRKEKLSLSPERAFLCSPR